MNINSEIKRVARTSWRIDGKIYNLSQIAKELELPPANIHRNLKGKSKKEQKERILDSIWRRDNGIHPSVRVIRRGDCRVCMPLLMEVSGLARTTLVNRIRLWRNGEIDTDELLRPISQSPEKRSSWEGLGNEPRDYNLEKIKVSAWEIEQMRKEDNLRKVYDVLMKVKDAKGKNKQVVLAANDTPMLRRVLSMALSQGRAYHIKKFPPFKQGYGPGDDERLLDHLDWINNHGSATDDDKKTIYELACCDKRVYELTKMIATKKLRCGVTAKTVNKVFPGLCYLVPYQRCSPEKKLSNIVYPALAQEKMDGCFAYAMLDGTLLTRQGQRYSVPGLQDGQGNLILVGEVIVLDSDGGRLPRRIINGIVNSLIKGGSIDDELASRFRFFAWDALTEMEFEEQESDRTYSRRFKDLTRDSLPARFRIVETQEVNNISEVRKYYDYHAAMLHEGIVVKNKRVTWRSGTSTEMVKVKNVSEGEFRIIGVTAGEGKYAGMLGALMVESEDGKVISKVGSGFTDEERKKGAGYWEKQIGRICTVKFESISDNEGGTHSLNHPRFVCLRHDKDTADTIGDLS